MNDTRGLQGKADNNESSKRSNRTDVAVWIISFRCTAHQSTYQVGPQATTPVPPAAGNAPDRRRYPEPLVPQLDQPVPMY